MQSLGRLRSYEGSGPYIFVSHAHRDSGAVLPIIARMMADGYRVWYDEGIDPGTEWDTDIAEHIEGCAYFIALISENYLASENCKDELNFVRDLGKPRLLVYLADVMLPAGMRMRLGRLQAIHKYTYSEEQDFYEKLYAAEGISGCMAPSVPEDSNRKAAEEAERQRIAAEEEECRRKEAAEAERQRQAAEEAERRRKCREEIVGDFVIASGVLKAYKGAGGAVVIPNGVTSIGDSAFKDCTGLTGIVIPHSITFIGAFAFNSCRRLISITYERTKQAWLSVQKGEDWDLDTSAYLVVYCTDGFC